jgi:hypothetical protein
VDASVKGFLLPRTSRDLAMMYWVSLQFQWTEAENANQEKFSLFLDTYNGDVFYYQYESYIGGNCQTHGKRMKIDDMIDFGHGRQGSPIRSITPVAGALNCAQIHRNFTTTARVDCCDFAQPASRQEREGAGPSNAKRS